MRKIAAFVLAICLFSCTSHSEHWETLAQVESYIEDRPDSALSVLERINASELSGREEMARYALLYSMALDKNYIDTTTFDVLQPAIDYYIEHGTPDEQLRTYYYQGRIYQNQGDDDSAMQCFMRGKEYCQKASDTLTMANLLVAQASIQYSIYKYDEFISNNLEAAILYKAIGRYDYEIYSLANALDGSLLNNDKALADSIMSIAQERVNEKPEFASVIIPYSLSYALKFGNMDEVRSILYYYESVKSIDDLDRLDIAEAYYKMGDAPNAIRVLASIPITSKTRSSLKYMAIMPSVLELNGDLAGALRAYRDFSTTIDSIHMNIFSHDLLFSKKRHEMEKANMIGIQKRDKVIWISVCVTFVLLIIISCIYYRYRLEKAKTLLDTQEKQRLQLEQENLRLKIVQLENESETLKEVLEKHNDLAKPIEDAIKVRIEMLNGLLASRITENDSYAEPYDSWKEKIVQDKDEFMNTTRLAFMASHPRFIEYLEQHGLTESEVNYVCLYAIGLRGKEVGEYMQLKRHYHISTDIRKKLGIDEHQTNIGIYIRKLMKQL